MQKVLLILLECPFYQQHPDAFETALVAALQKLPEFLQLLAEERTRSVLKVSNKP